MTLLTLVGGQQPSLGSSVELLREETSDLVVGESQRHEQFVPPPKGFLSPHQPPQSAAKKLRQGFLSPLASSPAFEELGGFMDDQRRDRKIFGFTEDGPIAVEELEPVRILPAKSPLRKESAFVEDGVRLVPSLQGQVQFRFKISKRGNSLNIQNPESLKFTFFLEVLPAVSQPRSGRKVVSQIIFLFWRFEILSVNNLAKRIRSCLIFEISVISCQIGSEPVTFVLVGLIEVCW